MSGESEHPSQMQKKEYGSSYDDGATNEPGNIPNVT